MSAAVCVDSDLSVTHVHKYATIFFCPRSGSQRWSTGIWTERPWDISYSRGQNNSGFGKESKKMWK